MSASTLEDMKEVEDSYGNSILSRGKTNKPTNKQNTQKKIQQTETKQTPHNLAMTDSTCLCQANEGTINNKVPVHGCGTEKASIKHE